MKKLLITSVLAILALALPGTADAQAKKPGDKAPAKPTAPPAAPDAAPAAPPAAPDAKPAEPPASDTKPAPPEKPATEAPKKAAQGTAGKVTAVDAAKKTITIGKTVYKINDETQYLNGEAPAQLTDIVVGQNVGLSYTATKAGKRTLVKVNVGVKQDEPKTEKADKADKPAETAKPKAGTGKKKNG